MLKQVNVIAAGNAQRLNSGGAELRAKREKQGWEDFLPRGALAPASPVATRSLSLLYDKKIDSDCKSAVTDR